MELQLRSEEQLEVRVLYKNHNKESLLVRIGEQYVNSLTGIKISRSGF